MQVLPALNVAEGDEENLRAQLGAVPAAEAFHLDVADGTMTGNVSWSDPARFRAIAGSRAVQVHLMVAEPEKVLASWLGIAPVSVIVHLDPLVAAEAAGGEAAVARLARLRDACHAAGVELLLAGAASLGARTLVAHRAYADGFLVLAVTPGRSGEEMQDAALGTVAAIREAFEEVPIWVDGGVNGETILRARDAGATAAVAASAVFASSDPASALTALQSV